MKNLITRSATGLVYILAIALGTLWSPIASLIVFGILFLLCFYELSQLLQFDQKLYILLALAGCGYILQYYGLRFYYGNMLYLLTLVTILPILLTALAYYVIFYSPVELAYDSSKIIFITVYLGLPFALFFTLSPPSSVVSFTIFNELFFLFVLIWCSDTFAYLIGRWIGKRPLTKISSKKTWEGLLGGFIMTCVAGFLIEFNFSGLQGNWIVVGLLVGIFAPLGDLAESKLKRIFNVKDSGKLLPGHGGFLDRLDSFLLVVPILYLYFLFV